MMAAEYEPRVLTPEQLHALYAKPLDPAPAATTATQEPAAVPVGAATFARWISLIRHGAIDSTHAENVDEAPAAAAVDRLQPGPGQLDPLAYTPLDRCEPARQDLKPPYVLESDVRNLALDIAILCTMQECHITSGDPYLDHTIETLPRSDDEHDTGNEIDMLLSDFWRAEDELAIQQSAFREEAHDPVTELLQRDGPAQRRRLPGVA